MGTILSQKSSYQNSIKENINENEILILIDLKCKSYCIISDNLKHDTNSVHAFCH